MRMKTRFIIVGYMLLTFLWVLNAVASPIGDLSEHRPYFSYDEDVLQSSPVDGPEVIRDIDIWGELTPDDDPTKGLTDGGQKEEGEKIPITAFLFSHGKYIHRWDMPFFETRTVSGFPGESPVAYKRPLPEPRYAPAAEGLRYEYQHGSTPKHQYIPPLDENILFEEISKHGYPYTPGSPKGKRAPGLTGAGYKYPYAGPQMQAVPNPGVQMRNVPAQRGVQYKRPVPGGLSPEARQREIAKQQAEKLKLEGKKGEIDQFRMEVAVSRAAGKPYGMILFGAALTSLAVIFRMFKLSFVIMAVWLIFYGAAIWRIIVDLV